MCVGPATGLAHTGTAEPDRRRILPISEVGSMPTKAQFRLNLMMYVLLSGAIILPRLWAARHVNDGGAVGTVSQSVNGLV